MEVKEKYQLWSCIDLKFARGMLFLVFHPMETVLKVCKGNAFPGISPHGNSLKSWVKFDQPHIPSLSLSLQVHPHHYCHCHDKPFLKCDWLHSMQIKHQLELPSHWLMGMWHRIWSHYQSIFFPILK